MEDQYVPFSRIEWISPFEESAYGCPHCSRADALWLESDPRITLCNTCGRLYLCFHLGELVEELGLWGRLSVERGVNFIFAPLHPYRLVLMRHVDWWKPFRDCVLRAGEAFFPTTFMESLISSYKEISALGLFFYTREEEKEIPIMQRNMNKSTRELSRAFERREVARHRGY